MRNEEAERVALGLVRAERLRRSNFPPAEILEIDGLVLTLSNVVEHELNGTLVEREPPDPGKALIAAQREFERRGHVFAIDLEVGRHPRIDETVRAMGLRRIVERPALAVDVAALDDPRSLVAGAAIRPVLDQGDVEALVELGTAVFGDDPKTAGRFYASSALGVPDARSFLAWKDGEAIGMSGAYRCDDGTGVFGVGVREPQRGHGVGAALTLTASRAFPGSDLAWLFPTERAVPMYERLGFRSVAPWEIWTR